MDEAITDHPAELQIHVILDNPSTHKMNDEWLIARPNVIFYFTPTSASWFNQVEIWLAIFRSKSLPNSSFGLLISAIRDFAAACNEKATLFRLV